MLKAAITSPQDGDVIIGPDADAVTFDASLSGAAPGGATLLLRWWSTVPPDPWAIANLKPENVDLDTIAIANQSAAASLKAPLRVGSQAITLSVKDWPGDTEADLKQVTQAASAGGVGTPDPCVVHVLVADPHLPPTDNRDVVTLHRAFGLWAQAPANWLTDDYKKLDRIAYSWTITPSDGGKTTILTPTRQGLSFQAADPVQRVPPLVGLPTVPTGVLVGPATLTLTVSITGADGSHQSQVSVLVVD